MSGARRAAAVTVVLALGACAGPPWFMGSPKDGRVSVPASRKNPSWRALQVDATTARARGETIYEIPALVALDDLQRLPPAHRERLVDLLERRAAEFRALGRPVPEWRDLDRLARLEPARAAGLRGYHAYAARAAGDESLAIGALDDARAAYDRAVALGAPDMEFRMRVLLGHGPPPTVSLAELRFEVAALPLRVVPPIGLAYVARGGRDRETLARTLAAARQEKQDALATSAWAALRQVEATGNAYDPDAADAGAREAAGDGPPPPSDTPGADAGQDGDAGAPVPVPANLYAWTLAGVTVEARLFPLLEAHPELLDDVVRAVWWVDLLLDEDPTSARVLELAAVVFGRAGRYGGTERMLMELAYATPDRALGLARGAEIWERLGRGREACAQWIRAARWRDDPDDPTWRKAVTCARRDPGAGDWREIRDYVLARARPERRAELAASLDAPSP
jgi:hypothetical protein